MKIDQLNWLANKIETYSSPICLSTKLEDKRNVITPRIAEIFKYTSFQKPEEIDEMQHLYRIENGKIRISSQLFNSFFSSLTLLQVFNEGNIRKDEAGYLRDCFTNAINAKEEEVAFKIIESGYNPKMSELEAAGKNNLESLFLNILEKILQENPNSIPVKDILIKKATVWACFNGWERVLERLLEICSNINCVDIGSDRRTLFKENPQLVNPLILALEKGHEKLVEPLINAGIDVKFESSTPTERKVRDICDRTFARYSTNRRCKYSDYLIEIAASKGMVGCLDLFANTWCSTFIIPIACKYGLERLAIKYLLNKAEVDDSDSCSIVFASQRGLFEYIKLFFDHFPKEKLPKIEDNLYKALDKATIKGHKKIVKLLLKKLMLFTPPARYSYKKPFETLFKVSDLGLNIDLKPLFQKNLRLMEKGIKESKYTGDFNTILENYYCQMMEFGIKSKHEHTVRLALDLLRSRFETLPQSAEALLINQAATHGLNQLIVDFFEDEKKENRAELMNALTPEQEYQDTPLVQACKSGIKSTALLFIILGADVSIRHRNTTALAEAAKQGWTDVVQLILDRLPEDKCKEHIQIKEGEYDTYPLALENACKAGHEEIALMLLQKGGFPEGEEKEIDSGNIISKMTSSGFSNAVSWLIKNYPQIYKNFEYTKMIKAKLLRYSSYKPNDEIMAQLILVGANVEELGGEFIRYLAKNGFNKSLSLALEQLPPKSKKEIIESLSNAGQSALWLACNNGHEESALLLIKAGAGCIPLVDEKETIYDIASDKSLEKVQKTILEQLLICYENGITTYENKQISYPDLFFKSRNLFDKKINDTCLEIPVNEGTQKFFVNSTILSERVEYFRPLFQGNYKDSCLMRSTVVGGDPAAFKVYLRFIYTGRIKSDAITHKNFKKLLFYSNFYYLEKSFNKKLVKALKTWRRQRPECANWL